MNQDQGKILVIDDEEIQNGKELARLQEIKDLAKTYGAPPIKKLARGNPKRPGSALTSAASDRTEKTADGWPIIELYEPVTVKGIWFRITRMKPGSGKLGLTMMTTEEVRADGLKEFKR